MTARKGRGEGWVPVPFWPSYEASTKSGSRTPLAGGWGLYS